jgi:hypothetical protein
MSCYNKCNQQYKSLEGFDNINEIQYNLRLDPDLLTGSTPQLGARKCLSTFDKNSKNEINLATWDCVPTAPQQNWLLNADGTIESKLYPKTCVTNNGFSKQLTLTDCNNATKFLYNNYSFIDSNDRNSCMNLYAADPGNPGLAVNYSCKDAIPSTQNWFAYTSPNTPSAMQYNLKYNIVTANSTDYNTKCLVAFIDVQKNIYNVGIYDYVYNHPTQNWFLNNNNNLVVDTYPNYCIKVNSDNTLTLEACSENSAKFIYDNNKFIINDGTNNKALRLNKGTNVATSGQLVDAFSYKVDPINTTWYLRISPNN